uniref:LPXTG cell wall anchor domain-containing protein n=1 Tax=Vaginimicrobium propionicum TaxID=1871034 RepID=UPI00138FD86F|nr:LPXTG cell wall anchor domain-containing protein [Vaginimicrobium propionicum]
MAAFAGVAALTLGSAVTATAANSVDEGSNIKSFEVTWSDNVDRYDPALKGTEVYMPFYCEVYEFKNGKKTGSLLGYEWPMLKLTVGKDETIPLNINLNKPEYEGVDKIGVQDCYQYRDGKWGPSQFSYSTGYHAGVKTLAMDQQANTDFKFKLTEGEWDGETYLGVIPEGKAPKVSIGLKVTQEGNTTTLTNKDNKPAVNTYVFADGADHRPSAEVDEVSREDTRITRASIGNDLNLFSGYTGRYKEYTLTASIDDPEEAKLFRIESVEGNESDGWTVNLSSVIRKITPEAPTVVDSNKCGVAGTVQVPESKYFDYEQVQKGTTVSVAALLKQDFKDKFVVEGDTKWELSVASKPCPLGPAEQLATPVAPKLINPSADDPSSCAVEPYVTIKETEGVAYTVTANGVELKANKDGKYIYPYNSKVEVKASTLDGYFLAEDAVTEWTWDSHDTAMNPACKPTQPRKKLPSTGAEVTSLLGISALLLLAGGALTARRFK